MKEAPLFPFGQLIATPAALRFLEERRVDVFALVYRHLRGDWGDLDAHDRAANERALVEGTPLFSSYLIGTEKVWIITWADRSVTSVLLPDDY